LSGEISVPLPTYFTVGDSAFPPKIIDRLGSSEQTEVCRNLIFLGRKGTFTTSEGVRIVFIGGNLGQADSAVPPGKYDPIFVDADAKSLQGARSAHILLTNQWPANVTRLSNIDMHEDLNKDQGVQAIANLCAALKPFYHFSSSPLASWEREPFRQDGDYDSLSEPTTTRFKSAAGVAKSSKEWMTAFTLDTSRPPQAQQTTAAPFLKESPPRKRPLPQDDAGGYSRFGDGTSDRRRFKRPRNMDPSDCFMCLNKPGFKTHMVVSIGDESLVTVLRGPLPLSTTFPDLSFSGHIMIIPHYHAADELAQGKRKAEEAAVEFQEMTRFRKALSKMIGNKSQGKLGAVCWEVNRTGIRHFHWQLIAVQADRIRKGLIEAAFKLLAEKRKHQPFEDCDPDQQLQQRSDYFRVWTWAPSASPVEQADEYVSGVDDTGTTKSMFFPLPANEQGFNIWFGREVIAGILQLEDRINWKAALHPNESEELKIEERDAAGLREDFADYDFAMQ
jgi:hypothetical protein